MENPWKNAVYALALVLVAGLLVTAFWPDPVPVDVATASRGELRVSVDEDGETRVRDRYVISAPVAGRVMRLGLREGDEVRAEQIVAEIRPLPLSARERDEQLARIVAAESLAREAQQQVRHAATDHAQARRELQRVEKLVKEGFVSPQGLERAQVAETTAADELSAAQFRARSAQADARAARAALVAIGETGRQGIVPLRSPASGRVLRINERSERVVAAGAVLMTVGNPQALEVVVDVLTADAVKIRPGMQVLIEGWGGHGTLPAKVRLVEPFAFTKVSALGVEEQRVNVIADFEGPAQALADGYRVEARIVLWSGQDVLKIPSGALFRRGEGWAVFVVDGSRARLRPVQPGQRGSLETEILEGIVAGDRVIVHPPNDIADQGRLRVRQQPLHPR